MINAAIVGLGNWGQVLVKAAQGKSEKIRFTAGVTRTVERSKDFADEHGFPLGPQSDYEKVLADPDIQAVVLATPHQQHADQIKAAAAAGKHVLVEKPFTLSKASAVEAVAAAERAGVVLALAHNRRFLPGWAEMRRRATTGALGTLLHVEANISGTGGMRYKPDSWRADRRESPAGGMGGMGIHMVDTLIGMFGPIADVHCISLRRHLPIDLDDTTSMLFRFESGMTGYLATLAATVQTSRLQVFGSEGSAELRQERFFEVRPVKGETETVDFGAFDKERAELDAFADAVTGGPAYPLPTGEAVHGIAVFDAIIASAESGQTVKVA